MKMFLCRWGDGTATFVNAVDVEDAIDRLDELGGADESMLTAIPGNRSLMFTFRACDSKECSGYEEDANAPDDPADHWDFAGGNGLGEDVWEALGDAVEELKRCAVDDKD